MRVLSLLWLALALSLSGVSATTWREAIPSTGVEAGDPNCQGDKKSPVNPNVNVPCRCPPTANAIADAVASATGGGATFPKGTDVESQIRRIEITLSAIQTLKCPASSTTLLGRLQSLTACRTNPNAGPQCSNPASTNGGSAGGTTAPANTAPSNGGGGGATAGAATGFRSLIPETGAAAGDPNCQGDKKSPVNPNVNVPCRCPPTDDAIASAVGSATNNGATFPSGTDVESQIRRFEITLSAIQTLKCPASSTTLLGRLQSLTACRSNPSAGPQCSNPASTAGASFAPPASLAGTIGSSTATGFRALIPATGAAAGDPNCQGDKKSPVNPNVNVPCRCPPTDDAIASAVGSATNNGATFPTGADVESQIRRFEITLSAIQTLKCPASSTTLLGRLQSLTACRSNPSAGPQCSNPASTNGGSAGGTTAPANPAPSNGGGGGGAAAGAATGFRALIPATGAAAGDPNCQGDKKSPVNPNVNVPCRCPPTDDAIASAVGSATNNGANFPTGADVESQIRRFEITLSAIQTLKCPASSTTLLGRLQSLTACRSNPSAGPQCSNPASTNDGSAGGTTAPANTAPSNGGGGGAAAGAATDFRTLIPATGAAAGDPNCQGDKKSPVNPNINVPCRCPPTDTAIAQVVAMRTGNGATFPTGADRESQIKRFEITLSAIQTLKCPASSTTLLGRLQALTACRTNPSTAGC